MPGFEPGDVVKVPFPCTDKATRQHLAETLKLPT
jgi:hypothetical protein